MKEVGMMADIKYPEMFDLWSNMRKIGWIQETYGEYDDEKDILHLKEDTPEEIMKLYNDLWDIVEKKQEAGLDVD